MAIIEIDRLTKRFGETTAVDDLSFTVDRGTVVGFLGANGAGKTTTLRILLGLITPTSGRATIDGRWYRDLPAPLRAVGAVLESSGANPGRTARNHLRIQAILGGVAQQRVEAVLELVDLTEAANERVAHFSLGMRQRLGLATALLNDPAVLILDEPTNGLDPDGVRWLRSLLRAFAAEGRTVLVSSHQLAEVAQTVDSVVILDRGRLVSRSTLAELTCGAQPVVRVCTPQAEALAAKLNSVGATAEALGPDRLRVIGASTEQIGRLAAAHGIPIFEAGLEALDLEQEFLRLTAPDRTETVR